MQRCSEGMKRLRGTRVGLCVGRIKGGWRGEKIAQCRGRGTGLLMIEVREQPIAACSRSIPLSVKALLSSAQVGERCHINEQACKERRQDFLCFDDRDEGAHQQEQLHCIHHLKLPYQRKRIHLVERGVVDDDPQHGLRAVADEPIEGALGSGKCSAVFEGKGRARNAKAVMAENAIRSQIVMKLRCLVFCNCFQ